MQSFRLAAYGNVDVVLYLLADKLRSVLYALFYLFGHLAGNYLQLVALEVVGGHAVAVDDLHSGFLDVFPVAVKHGLQVGEHLISCLVYLYKLGALFVAYIVDLADCGFVALHKFVVRHHEGVFLHYYRAQYLSTRVGYLVSQYLEGDSTAVFGQHSFQRTLKFGEVRFLQQTLIFYFLSGQRALCVQAYYSGRAYLALVNGKFAGVLAHYHLRLVHYILGYSGAYCFYYLVFVLRRECAEAVYYENYLAHVGSKHFLFKEIFFKLRERRVRADNEDRRVDLRQYGKGNVGHLLVVVQTGSVDDVNVILAEIGIVINGSFLYGLSHFF